MQLKRNFALILKKNMVDHPDKKDKAMHRNIPMQIHAFYETFYGTSICIQQMKR